MSTMTLIDDYVDALLDGSGLDHRTGHDAMGHDAMRDDAMGHDGMGHEGLRLTASDRDAPAEPAPHPAGHDDRPAVSAAVLLLRVDTDTDAGAPAPPSHAAARPCPEPAPAPTPPPVPAKAFVPVFVPATPPAAAGAVAAIHEPSVSALATSHRWIRVTVGNDSYALELLRVQEVVRLAPIVALRGAARAVLGVMNLRGRIVPVVDLGLWLAAGCVHGDERSRIVVVERDDEMIGVLVSTVEDVVTLGRERIEPPLGSSDPGAIVGIARVGAAPTVLLDANALFG